MFSDRGPTPAGCVNAYTTYDIMCQPVFINYILTGCGVLMLARTINNEDSSILARASASRAATSRVI